MSADSPEDLDLGPPEYLAYRVLEERHAQDNQETGRTKFFKLCCLADHLLLDEFDRDIGFPRHWYRYGEVEEEHSLYMGVAFRPDANHQKGQAYYPADRISESDFDIPDEVAEDIFAAARIIVKRHGKKDSEELQKLQYKEYAPNEFILTYSELRWHLVALSSEQERSKQYALYNFQDKENNQFFELLDKMLETYPHQDYEDVYSIYLTWDDTMRLLYEQGARPRELHEFLEYFIEKLSQTTLRFEHRRNIPEDRLQKWRDEREDQLEDLKQHVEEVRSGLLEDRHPSEVLDTISDSYDKTILEDIKDI